MPRGVGAEGPGLHRHQKNLCSKWCWAPTPAAKHVKLRQNYCPRHGSHHLVMGLGNSHCMQGGFCCHWRHGTRRALKLISIYQANKKFLVRQASPFILPSLILVTARKKIAICYSTCTSIAGFVLPQVQSCHLHAKAFLDKLLIYPTLHSFYLLLAWQEIVYFAKGAVFHGKLLDSFSFLFFSSATGSQEVCLNHGRLTQGFR